MVGLRCVGTIILRASAASPDAQLYDLRASKVGPGSMHLMPEMNKHTHTHTRAPARSKVKFSPFCTHTRVRARAPLHVRAQIKQRPHNRGNGLINRLVALSQQRKAAAGRREEEKKRRREEENRTNALGL